MPTPLFDPSELDPISLEVWRDFLGHPVKPTPMTVGDLYGFGTICMFEGSGVPEAVTRRIGELDPEHLVAEHMNTVRRARAPKPRPHSPNRTPDHLDRPVHPRDTSAEDAAARTRKYPVLADGLIDPNPTRSRGFILSRDNEHPK